MNQKNYIYWQYPGFQQAINPENQLNIKQGNTPLEDHSHLLAPAKQSTTKLFLKREDLNPNGSFKDRALAYQISYLQQQGEKYCVLSSSGNAAISCCAFCQKTNIKPIILVSPTIPENKLQKIITHQPFILIKTPKARRFAKYLRIKYHFPILNPSSDSKAAFGFETLGWEIFNQLPSCHTIFSYSTSGASIIGIINFYQKNNLTPPKIVAVKLSDQKNPNFYLHTNNKKIISIIEKNNGSLITVPANQAQAKHLLLQENKINSSIEGAACLVAIDKYLNKSDQKSNTNPNENIVCIISGTEHQISKSISDINIPTAKSLSDIDSIIKQIKH